MESLCALLHGPGWVEPCVNIFEGEPCLDSLHSLGARLRLESPKRCLPEAERQVESYVKVRDGRGQGSMWEMTVLSPFWR